MKPRTLSVAIATIAMGACTLQNKTAETHETPAQRLFDRLNSLKDKGYMYGHQDDPFYGITWEWEHGRSDTKELVGDYPAIMGFDLGGVEMGDAKNLDSVPFNWMKEEIIAHHERGGIITISWHARNPLTGTTAWIQSDNEAYDKAVEERKAKGKSIDDLVNPRNTVKEMLEGGCIHDKAIAWLDNIAAFMSDLKTKDGDPIPVLFRPWHENTGSWFWWGDPNCTADEYKALWNMTQDYLNEKLPGQLLWAYSPSPKSMEHFLERWPGDDRVQLLGSDCYQGGSSEEFQEKLGFWLSFMNDYAQDRNILIAITECGRKNSDIPDWWTQVLDPVAKQYPICYCLPWRNYSKEHFGASKDASTAEDFKNFYDLPHTLFAKDIKE